MPHFLIDCSQNIIGQIPPEEIMSTVYAAEATGLFAANDIKVRLQPHQYYKLGEGKSSFIHVFR